MVNIFVQVDERGGLGEIVVNIMKENKIPYDLIPVSDRAHKILVHYINGEKRDRRCTNFNFKGPDDLQRFRGYVKRLKSYLNDNKT